MVVIISFLLVWVYIETLRKVSHIKQTNSVITSHSVVERTVRVRDCDMYTEYINQIKYDILKTYENGGDNKREQIVREMIRLNQYEDTSQFIDEFPYIHDFIFNHYAS